MEFGIMTNKFAMKTNGNKKAMKDNSELQPLSLVEDAETGDRFVLYATPCGFELELRFEREEPWATRKQMTELFGRDISRITRHINAVFEDGELDRDSNVRKTHIAGSDKPVEIYSLDVVLAVGYRVKGSKQAIIYRRWANSILKQYLLKGFVLDQRRLKNPDGRPDFFDDLLDKIREIRASEKRMWTRVLELASFCSDYEMATPEEKQEFFATIQNAMHWAVAQETAADFVYRNVDASKPDCGIIHFDRERREIPTAAEAGTAKNYYGEPQIKALNVLTSATLEFFESQAEQGRLTTLSQFLGKMRDFIKLDGRPLIPAQFRGKISDTKKKEKVSVELAAYRDRIRLEREAKGEIEVGKLLEQARLLAADKRQKQKKK
jgi:hypothetical protein